MGLINGEDKDAEFDLEQGWSGTEDNIKKESSPCAAKQDKSLFAKVSGGFVATKEEKPSLYCNEPNLSSVSKDVSSKFSGQDSVDMEKTPVKEKCKKGSNKKAPKPPRPPIAPSLDAADHKLIRELTELAMLKRARIERLKAIKKIRASKSPSSSSSSSSMLATVFTVVFCIVIIFQGMSSGSSSVASFQGSPLPTDRADGSLVSAQFPLNPLANNPYYGPSLESHNNFVKHVTSSDWPEQTRRRTG